MATAPTPQRILDVMEHPEASTAVLKNDAWRAADIAYRLGCPWQEVEPLLQEMERWGHIVRVNVRGTRVPRYRLPGG